jgi:hypothetical protein
MTIKFLEGKFQMEVTGVPNRDGSGKLSGQRLTLLKNDGSDVDLTKGGDNHVKAKIDSEGRSFTSAECVNQAMMSQFVPKANSNDSQVDYTKVCSSVYHLINGNVRTAGGSRTSAFQKSKSLKLGNAVDQVANLVFLESKVNNTTDMNSNGIRTQESAPKRIQEADLVLDIQNMSIFLFDEGDASVKHCPTDPESIEKVLENIRFLMTKSGISDVSNIRSDKRVQLKTCINNVSFRGFVFTPEQVVMLIKASAQLLSSTRKSTSHGNFKVINLTVADQDGKLVDVKTLKASDIELDHEMIDEVEQVKKVTVKKVTVKKAA